MTASRLSGCKYSSDLAWWWPPIASPILPDYGLQVHLHTCSPKASECTSNLAPFWPPSVSPNSHDCGLQVWMISASKGISTLARLWHRSPSPNSLNYSLQVYHRTHLIVTSSCTQLWPPSACPISLDHCLQVYLQMCMMTASKCISKLDQSRPQSASLCSVDHDVVKRWSWKADSQSSIFRRPLNGIHGMSWDIVVLAWGA